MSNSPIGVFDSGVGGLTVLKVLAEHFPSESFLYLGDTARLPYGSKSPETIRKYSEQNIRFLIQQGVKAVVIACNSASSQIVEKDFDKVPVFTVIEPGAKAALHTSEGTIGVLGTRATIASGLYEKTLLRLSSAEGRSIQIFSQACPLFVPLAEEGWVDDPITNLIAYRYCQPLAQKGVDTLILGCTHYPILKSSIQKAVGGGVALIDSGSAITLQLKEEFSLGHLSASSSSGQRIDIRTTDISPQFEAMVHQLMSPLMIHSLEVVTL
ncbi:MAG: glutamate racemase [Oligoflexia bacterium]|nr:MAG: glutamate racemase [Oligoflexia bacterium]